VNPFTTARRKLMTELDELREENRRLTKRLQIIEDRGVAVVDLSARVDSELHASSGKEVEGIRGVIGNVDHMYSNIVEDCQVFLIDLIEM